MANTKDLKQRIAEHLSQKQGAGYEARKEKERQKAYAFAEPIADLFNSNEVQELLASVPGREVQLFCHSRSLMAAAYSKQGPDYELVVNQEGLCKKIRGEISEKHILPASLDIWAEVLPYGKNFDSSDGDYTFKPPIDEYMQRIENKLERWIK